MNLLWKITHCIKFHTYKLGKIHFKVTNDWNKFVESIIWNIIHFFRHFWLKDRVSFFDFFFGFSCSNVFQLNIYGLKSEYLMYSYFISKALKVQIEYKYIDSNYTYINCTDEQLHGNSNEKLECVVYFNLDFNYVQITRVSNCKCMLCWTHES